MCSRTSQTSTPSAERFAWLWGRSALTWYLFIYFTFSATAFLTDSYALHVSARKIGLVFCGLAGLEREFMWILSKVCEIFTVYSNSQRENVTLNHRGRSYNMRTFQKAKTEGHINVKTERGYYAYTFLFWWGQDVTLKSGSIFTSVKSRWTLFSFWYVSVFELCKINIMQHLA